MAKTLFVLISAIILFTIFGSHLPPSLHSTLYALSLTIKATIIFALPFLIFCLLCRTIAHLAISSTKLIPLLFAAICTSNYFSTLFSYLFAKLIYFVDINHPFNLITYCPNHNITALSPTWQYHLEPVISNNLALLLGVMVGSALALTKRFRLSQQILYILDGVTAIILKMLGQLLPFFILGFISKMQYEKTIHTILGSYLQIAIIIIAAQLFYILFIYLISANFNFKRSFALLRNALPPAISGFTTMSSAISLPSTINATNNNVASLNMGGKWRLLARSVVSSTVNVHLVGDCIAIPILAYAIMHNHGIGEPSFTSYLIFAFYFVVAKFSVAAIPGGGIVVMLPILYNHLSFQGDMLSLITTLYILLDPFITMTNVLGNGAFALIFTKFAKKLQAKNNES